MWSLSRWLYREWNCVPWHWWGDNLELSPAVNALFIWLFSDCSVTWLNRATNVFAVQISRLVFAANPALQVTMDNTLKEFTWPPKSTILLNVSDVMISMNAVKELRVVGQIQTASIQTDLTIARAREDLPEIHPDVFKCLACALTEQYVIETVNVNMPEEIAIGMNSAINLCRVRFNLNRFSI